MTHELLNIEGRLITSFYKKNNIRAKVDWSRTIEIRTGYFRFALKLDERERFTTVESSRRELASLLAANRRKLGYSGELHVIPTAVPYLALETPHPEPEILWATNKLLFDGLPHTMALGRSYLSEPREEMGDFEKNPHFLVAGITNAGKSVLLQNMVLSLAARTSPTDLKLLLIDLKNEDLVPLRGLPHVTDFAGTPEEAFRILKELDHEKELRIADPSRKPYRIVCVIDEMAHLAVNREMVGILGRLASIGRTKWINIIGATQHPTREGGMGSLLKANFGDREVGQVAPGQSQYATNRPGTHAELLPGKGSFLRCVGANVYRFQSYFIDEKDRGQVTGVVRGIAGQWRYELGTVSPSVDRIVVPTGTGSVPVRTGRAKSSHTSTGVTGRTDTTSEHSSVNVTSTENFFPISETRPLTSEESKELRRIVSEGLLDFKGKYSQNKALEFVFQGRGPQRVRFIKEALG